jgi:cytochrome c-type biogenesis protein CcmH
MKANSVLRRAFQCFLLALAVTALAGAGDPTSRFNDLGHHMMCICGCNQILLECNHVGCPDSDGMRNELMAAVARGDSDSLVEQAFVQKYGPTVLAAPSSSGFDRTAWVMPFAVLGVATVAVVLVIRGWRNRPPSAPTGGMPPDGGSPLGGPQISSSELEKFRDQARKETEL